MNEIEKIFNKSRVAMYDELCEKHIKPLHGNLSQASVEYFCTSGSVSGSFRGAIHNLLKENDEICEIAYSPVWLSVENDGYPPFNQGVLVFIADEDNHITAGMWDIDLKWVLLDEYRTVYTVTHWMKMPELPKP